MVENKQNGKVHFENPCGKRSIEGTWDESCVKKSFYSKYLSVSLEMRCESSMVSDFGYKIHARPAGIMVLSWLSANVIGKPVSEVKAITSNILMQELGLKSEDLYTVHSVLEQMKLALNHFENA